MRKALVVMALMGALLVPGVASAASRPPLAVNVTVGCGTFRVAYDNPAGARDTSIDLQWFKPRVGWTLRYRFLEAGHATSSGVKSVKPGTVIRVFLAGQLHTSVNAPVC